MFEFLIQFTTVLTLLRDVCVVHKIILLQNNKEIHILLIFINGMR